MKTAVILAAGAGTKMWPYTVIRPKVMIPVANKPIIAYNVELLLDLGFDNIIIVGSSMIEQIKNYFRKSNNIKIIKTDGTNGTAFSLNAAKEFITEDEFLVLYGDTIINKQDVESLIFSVETGNGKPSALIEPLGEEISNDWICCLVNNNSIENITGHPRYKCSHRFCGFALTHDVLEYIEYNSGIFSNVNVGVMAPVEGYLEMSLADYISDGNQINAVITNETFLDVDKPWHILMANSYIVNKLCMELSTNILDEGAYIDPSAEIKGFVKMGKDSKIGRNVLIKGSLIAGDNTIIDNGAILNGNVVIGNDCFVGNYCQISGGSVIGNKCIVDHCAEFAGVTMERVYLYHYMEFCGVIGCCTDLGAATVCGTLRFDDGVTEHRTKNRREKPKQYSNSCYLGDFSRTGVNAIIMPGCKTGVYSIVGPGVVLTEDLPDNTMVMVDQQLIKKQWGPERYGW